MSSKSAKTSEWLESWDPNIEGKWESKIAWKTLWVTTYALTLGFMSWFLVSALAPKLNNLPKQEGALLAGCHARTCRWWSSPHLDVPAPNFRNAQVSYLLNVAAFASTCWMVICSSLTIDSLFCSFDSGLLLWNWWRSIFRIHAEYLILLPQIKTGFSPWYSSRCRQLWCEYYSIFHSHNRWIGNVWCNPRWPATFRRQSKGNR